MVSIFDDFLWSMSKFLSLLVEVNLSLIEICFTIYFYIFYFFNFSLIQFILILFKILFNLSEVYALVRLGCVASVDMRSA